MTTVLAQYEHKMTSAEWQALGEALFGPDQMQWRFVCPSCGTVMTVQDWKDAGAPHESVAYACIGRWTGAKRTMWEKGEGPCNYSGGGLIRINPVEITDLGLRVFAFAEGSDGDE